MIKKFPDIEIPEDNPWLNDKLDRKKTGVSLFELVKRIDSSFVLAIDGAWGTGKTTFVKMWTQYLQHKGIKTICFNAWEHDYVENPLVVFIAETIDAVEKDIDGDSKTRESFRKFKELGTQLIKRSIPAMVRLVSAGLLNLPDNYEEEIGKLLSEFATNQLKSYAETKQTIKDFRCVLRELVQALPNQKLVFVIDELDRCRPNFSIELLEVVKHFFETEGVVFVLSLDKSQLENSIQAVYGHEFNSSTYLRRFIDLTFTLSTPPIIELADFYRGLLTRYDLPTVVEKFYPDHINYMGGLYELVPNLANNLDLTFRDVNQLLLRISITLKTLPNEKSFLPPLFVALCFISEFEPTLFVQFKDPNENTGLKKILNILSRNLWNSNQCITLQALIAIGYEELRFNDRRMRFEVYVQSKFSPQPKEENLLLVDPRVADKIIDLVCSYGFHSGVQINKILETIELSYKFVLDE